jgi:outer membrane protein assembly factor BamB
VTDGSTVWKATDEAASYASPIAATVDGRRQVIFVTRLNVVAVDPDNGGVRFRFPFGKRGPTVNAANPLLFDHHLFVTASYGVGAELALIGPGSAKQVWASDDVLSSQYTTSVLHRGALFGIDGRQDAGVARLRAIDPLAGRVLWTQEGFGTGTLILADDELLIMKTDGTLVLVDPAASEYRELAKAHLFPTIVQALPALADGFFYARDTQTLKCFDLGAKP